MKAEIISIGTEILRGEIVDTNASYLAGQLPLLGIELERVTQVGDDRDKLIKTLRYAREDSDIIITTGGLGPTADDITRESIAAFLGEEMKVDAALLEELKAFFKRYGVPMPQSNTRQAMLIPSAHSLRNPQGTAPGWRIEKEERLLLALPGPPREMQLMWKEEVMPYLQSRQTGDIICSRTLKTFGLTEAKVDEMVNPLLASAEFSLGIYAKPDGIHLRLLSKASDARRAEEGICHGEAQIREILGSHIWGVDDEKLTEVVARELLTRQLSIATWETLSGGVLATALSGALGDSGYYGGGLVATSGKMLTSLGVNAALLQEHGFASVKVAEAMAEVVRCYLSTNIGVGVTGIKETTDKPGGRILHRIFISIAMGDMKRNWEGRFPGVPAAMRHRVMVAALFELRQMWHS